jgi:hypothetical protein
MDKRNYRQAKRQKEEARKTRQLQKQQRKGERDTSVGVTLVVEPSEEREPIDPVPAPETL